MQECFLASYESFKGDPTFFFPLIPLLAPQDIQNKIIKNSKNLETIASPRLSFAL